MSLDNRPDVEEILATLQKLHQKMAHLPPIDNQFIDRAKREGRS